MSRRAPYFSSMTRYCIVPLLLLVASCSRSTAPAASAQTPVILISIDTLRSDRLPAYGYKGVATPALDALRADSILYERAFSHCPLTLPSHASVFTGQLPAETGIRDNTGYRLASESVTLAELLAKRGYTTGAAVSSYVLRKGSGIERGFEWFDDDVGADRSGLTLSSVQRAGSSTVEVAEKWLSANAAKTPFFFLHLYEPHSPYQPPEPYRSLYSAYDGEIAHADAIVGGFLQRLKALGIYDRALVILFSDHGEGLNEHGEEEHGIFLYREALQVPLFVKLPGAKRGGEAVSAPVQLSDIFPTVLAQTGGSHETRSSSGARSLLEASPSARHVYSESYYPRLHFGWSDLHSLINADHHFIQAPEPELYATADVAQKNNILEEQRRVYAAMRKNIEPLIRAADAPKAIDPEEAAKLAALGYLGSTAAVEGPLPDPKTKTETFRAIREAFKLFRSGRYQEAVTFYQKLLRENPRMLDLWDISARALLRLGRPVEAIASAKEALKLSPQSTHLAILIATISLETGKLDDAQKHAELALRGDPVQSNEILAGVALARNDVTGAEKAAQAALAAEPGSARASMTLARIEKHKGNFAAALEHLDAALRNTRPNSPLFGLQFLRGDVLARLGRSPEAERAFREEIRLFPEDPQAYKNLILLQVSEGRVKEATQLIHDLEKAAPTPPSYAAISETLQVVGDERGARYWALRGLKRYPDDRQMQRLGASMARGTRQQESAQKGAARS